MRSTMGVRVLCGLIAVLAAGPALDLLSGGMDPGMDPGRHPGIGTAAWATEAAPAPGSDEARPAVELDQLLKLPSHLEYSMETRGGDTRAEWRNRFREIAERLEEERRGLAEAEEQLLETAGSTAAWQVAPPLPGASQAGSDAPLDFALRKRIDRHREEIELLESRLNELEIEANLVGVPEDWRR